MNLDRFREPRFAALLDRARTEVEKRNGVLTGSFTVKGLTAEEYRSLNGLLGLNRKPGASGFTVELSRLDTTLSSGYGIGLVELLETLGPPLRPKGEEKARRARLRSEVLAPALASSLNETAAWYRDWLSWVERYRVGHLSGAGDTTTLGQAVRVLEAVDAREPAAPPLLLPELAVRVTGSTKALNHGRPLSTLVLRALVRRSTSALPPDGNAEECRALWEENDVVPDDLASRVLALNLPARGAGLGEWLTGAAQTGVPFQVTLHQLVRLPVAVGEPVVYVCENPAVLRRAAERFGARSAPLLCTEGWPSAAFHRLARAVSDGGGRLRYHGDFDWPGLAMTRRVVERHGAVPWRMTAADYLAHEADEYDALSGDDQPSPWDPALAEAMARHQRIVYEESVVDTLLGDLAR
ncbi:TIGR02679 family protein [Nocardiopsis sp. EMB25]|uniref:TIGR02679 family protein n=1 Tax=Nocardiopsis sp. EMB25 TaxID=2835867 RepID=UPI002284F5AC|nr:TIGR02679 family protein [Nocardiopsis sp. EMB25]MCY9784378.1 TIGR02679 family protein [Nocardiopsis sp. EMB25]